MKPKKQKKGFSLHSRFSLYNFAAAIVPVLLAIALTFLFMISLIHMIYSGDSNGNVTMENSRDIITAYFCQFNIREIENSYKEDKNDEPDFFASRAIKRLERYGFAVCVGVDSETVYLSESYTESFFGDLMMNSPDYGGGLIYLDNDNTHIRDAAVFDSGRTVTVTIKNTGEYSEEKTVFESKLWQLSDAGFISILLLVVAFATVFDILLVRLLTKKIMKPIDNLSDAAEKIKNGNLDEPVVIDNSTQELGELSQSFEEMRVQLKSSVDSKLEYEKVRRNTYSGLNHDIRTAVTTIKGYTQGLVDGIANTPEKQKRYISAIYLSTESLEKLMDALSEVTNLETNTVSFHFKERDMYKLITKWYSESAGALMERGVNIRVVYGCDKRVFCNVDTFHIERTIDNILANCLKYKKPESSSIDVDIVTGISEDGMFRIIYQDNGIGISPDDAERIFDIFFRADEARSNVRGGSGIGLSIVKQIVLRHGGTITAGGEKGKGLTLTMKLPIIRTEDI